MATGVLMSKVALAFALMLGAGECAPDCRQVVDRPLQHSESVGPGGPTAAPAAESLPADPGLVDQRLLLDGIAWTQPPETRWFFGGVGAEKRVEVRCADRSWTAEFEFCAEWRMARPAAAECSVTLETGARRLEARSVALHGHERDIFVFADAGRLSITTYGESAAVISLSCDGMDVRSCTAQTEIPGLAVPLTSDGRLEVFPEVQQPDGGWTRWGALPLQYAPLEATPRPLEARHAVATVTQAPPRLVTAPREPTRMYRSIVILHERSEAREVVMLVEARADR